MTKGLVCSFASLAISLVACCAPLRAAELVKTETGELSALIARLSSRQYVLGQRDSDPRPYVDPSPALNAFRHVASELAWGDVADAAGMASKIGYEIVDFTDSQTQRHYFVLREDLRAVKTLRGWGSYIFNPGSRIDALVEVPHPFADTHTPEIGGLVFDECQAKGFLLSGSHREKADVPDLVDSVFHQVHVAWVGPAGHVTAWQVHGFSSIKHAFPQGAQVVASTGDGAIAPVVAELDAMLEQRGLTSYVFNELPAKAKANRRLNGGVPGVTFTSLAAAKNEQGRHSRSLGGSFVHVELEENVRADAAHRKLAGSAIAAVIAGATPRDGAIAEAVAATATATRQRVAKQPVVAVEAATAGDMNLEPQSPAGAPPAKAGETVSSSPAGEPQALAAAAQDELVR